MRKRAWLFLLPGLLACATAVFPPDANRMRADHAPTPFSAAEIREACPDGTWIRLRIEVPDEAEVFLVFRFLNGSRTEATITTAMFDAGDKPLGEPTAERQRWADLQAHASFPKARTRIDPASLDTFRGRLDGWLYTVNEVREGKAVLTRYAFARDLPGPPVLLEKFTEGKLTLRMTMAGRGGE